MRADAERGLEVFGVHEEGGEFVAVAFEAEEYAESDVVDAALHGAVHGLGVVGVVVLGTGGMELLVAFLVVGLLEEDVGADAGVLELAVVLDGGGGDVDVDAADGAVLVLDVVDGLDGLEDVLDGVVDGILAAFDGESLVSHVLKGNDLAPDLVLGELLARDVLVLHVVGAVDAAVDAVVGEVERREHDDAVAVEVLLDLLGEGVDFGVLLGDVAVEEDGGLAVGESLAETCLVQDFVDERLVVAVLLGVVE